MSEKATGAVPESPVGDAGLCRRCGAEPRSGKNRWGSKCIGASRKRGMQTPANVQTPETNAGGANTAGLSRDGVVTGRLKVALAKIAELEDEVRRFKRALAERAPVSGGQEVRVPVRGVRAGEVCIHGSTQCGVLYCRAGRS